MDNLLWIVVPVANLVVAIAMAKWEWTRLGPTQYIIDPQIYNLE